MKPLVLIPGGESDTQFRYASGFDSGLYVWFGEGDDVLVANGLEIDRARVQCRAASVLGMKEAGYVADPYGPRALAMLAAKLVRDKGHTAVRVSPRLEVAYHEELLAQGLDVSIDRDLFTAQRRHKSSDEASLIHAAQRAAESALVEVVRILGSAEIHDGVLHVDGHPLTSERLYARAQFLLGEIGYSCPDMIIAGSPECAMPHFRGEGPIRANQPVIIDIFPVGRSSHYHGDLTRTVVVGQISEEVQRMHEAAVQALDAGIESIRAGVPCVEVHQAVCQVLVDRGFGTTAPGYEGPDGVAKMNHSTGHGVGLDIHEAPGLRDGSDDPLVEGDVVTVEPGLYKMGFGGVRVEDTGLVTRDGFKNFTRIPRSLHPADYL